MKVLCPKNKKVSITKTRLCNKLRFLMTAEMAISVDYFLMLA